MKYILYALPLASAVIIYTARLLELKTRRNIVPGEIREYRSFAVFFLIGATVWLGSVAEHLFSKPEFALNWFASGWILAIASFWLRHRTIAALGRFWSVHVEIRECHELVQEGPFRFVRHPCYLSMLLEVLCIPLVLQSPVMLLVAPLLYIPALIFRLRLEETALLEKFGDAYRSYMERTPALVPLQLSLFDFVWQRPTNCKHPVQPVEVKYLARRP